MGKLTNKIAKIGIAVVAAAGVLLAPSIANADDYVPSGPTTIVAGGTGTFSFSGFESGATVTFTLTGENASGASLAVITPAVVDTKSLTKVADASGAAAVSVTLPSNATGSYTLTGTDGTTTQSTSIVVSTTSSSAAATSGLSNTSASNTALWFWAIGGGLVLVGAAIATAVAASKRRAQAA